jgi:hypothetical protein
MRQEGGKVYYRGNVFELWSPKDTPDTIMVENPMTGDIEMRISRVDSFPVRMNGEEIFRVSELSRMEKETFDRTTGAEVKKYFLEKMKPVMAKMMDGNYAVFTYIILDKKGRIVYINPISISDRDWRKMPDSYEPLRQSLNKELTKIIEQTSKRFAPVKRTGKVVIMRLEEILPRVTFVVKDHEVTIKE